MVILKAPLLKKWKFWRIIGGMSKGPCRFKIGLLLFLGICVFPAAGTYSVYAEETKADEKATEKEAEAWKMYSEALELIVNDETDQAIGVLEEVIKTYPRTQAAVKAKSQLKRYSGKLDRSGIVSFYLGNMISTTWAAYSIPMILEIDDGLVLGTTGLIGVGSGVYSSWLMTRNIDMSLGQDLWIEFIEAASVINFQYGYGILGERIKDPSVRWKVNIGGQTFVSLGSRAFTYLQVRDAKPSAGKAFTVINSYAWAQFYVWLTLAEIFNSDNSDLNYSLGIIVPDLAALGSYHLWDRAGWSPQRAGIISVSGIGGMLTGIFTNMIISELFNYDIDPVLSTSIIMACSFSGKIIGAKASTGMEPDTKANKAMLSHLNFLPVFGPGKAGIMVNYRY